MKPWRPPALALVATEAEEFPSAAQAFNVEAARGVLRRVWGWKMLRMSENAWPYGFSLGIEFHCLMRRVDGWFVAK